MTTKFPSNPEHGMIYESQPGIFFVYDASTQCWSRSEGGLVPAVATPTNDGLMSADDFIKFNRLVVPPPQTTITAENCGTIFETGIISLQGGDQFVTVNNVMERQNLVSVEGRSPLVNEAAGIDESNAELASRELHMHSHSFNFGVNVQELFDYMVENGKFRVSAKQGVQGDPGDAGTDGKDELNYGPIGEQGDPGANAPFAGSLLDEAIPFKQKKQLKRAVVDIYTEEVSPDENYLVVTRANIGNPAACPNTIRMGEIVDSTWLVCVPDTISSPTFESDLEPSECRKCAGQVYYLDFQSILQPIQAEFDKEVTRIREGMENIATWWLTIMSAVFDEQKAALCCALEYCRSQSRNVDTRRYIEQSRIQAAQSDHALLIDGDPTCNPTTTDVTTTIMHPACEPEGFGTLNRNNLPNNADPINSTYCVPHVTKVDGRARIFNECPPGFTPRDIYRAIIRGDDVEDIADLDDDLSDVGSGDVITVSSLANPDLAALIEERSIPAPDAAAVEPGLLVAADDSGQTTSITLHQFASDVSKYDMLYVAELGAAESSSHSRMHKADPGKTASATVYKFTDELPPGVYNLCIANHSNVSTGFKLVIATQNAVFLQGHGSGWKDSMIVGRRATEGGIDYAAGTIVKCEQGPLEGFPWWVKIRVLDTKRPEAPYSTDCGAAGPLRARLDGRMCAEYSRSQGNPMLRERQTERGDGSMVQWYTTKSGDSVLPDSAAIRMSGLMEGAGKLVMCRVAGGNYTCGFNHNGKSAQVLVEQLEQFPVKHVSALDTPSMKSPVTSAAKAKPGSRNFKCTLLLWDGNDCQGQMETFSTITVLADEPWALSGVWDIGDDSIGFSVDGIDNDFGSFGSSDPSVDYFVTINGHSPDRHKRAGIDLPKGKYVATIASCCIQSGSQYTGHIRLKYKSLDRTVEKQFPNLGAPGNLDQASRLYRGLAIEFDHAGGQVIAELVSPVTKAVEGEIVVRIAEANASNKVTPVFKPQITGETCQMQAGHLRWYVDGWASKECDGAVIQVKGQDYIVVRREGRPGRTPCLDKFNNPAIAWPTIDGQEFIGIPDTGSVTFKRDKVLEQDVVSAVAGGRYDTFVGDLSSVQVVLFPTVRQ